MTLTVNARPRFDEVYGLQPNVSYDSWNWSVKPGIKLFDYIQVTFGTAAKKQIDKALDEVRDKTNRDLAEKLDFKNNVEAGWADLHRPIKLDRDGQMWLSIKPLSLHASPLISDKDYTRIFAGLRSKNEVILGSKPQEQDIVGLPILKPALPGDLFKLSLLSRLEYENLLTLVRSEWGGKTLLLDWGRLRFDDFRIYQSGDRLVIGAKVKIMHKTLPYVDGWLYLTGIPSIENNRLSLRDLDYRANTNNPIVQVIAFLFQEPAKRELERRLTFDLSKPLDEAVSKVNAIPPAPIGDWGKISIRVQRPVIGTPVVDASSLLVPITVAGKAEAAFFPYKGDSDETETRVEGKP